MKLSEKYKHQREMLEQLKTLAYEGLLEYIVEHVLKNDLTSQIEALEERDNKLIDKALHTASCLVEENARLRAELEEMKDATN